MESTTNNIPYILLLKAFEQQNLEDYLIGKDEYNFPNRWVEEPTDLGSVFISGFNEYIQNGDSNYLKNETKKAILKLLNSAIGTWWVIVIIYAYYFRFNPGTLLFQIDISPLIPGLNASLKKFKSELINNKTYVGYRFKNGLWEQIEQLVPKINLKLHEFKISEIEL